LQVQVVRYDYADHIDKHTDFFKEDDYIFNQDDYISNQDDYFSKHYDYFSNHDDYFFMSSYNTTPAHVFDGPFNRSRAIKLQQEVHALLL
jgi:hypothetical protein